jgi:hypothetical protein
VPWVYIVLARDVVIMLCFTFEDWDKIVYEIASNLTYYSRRWGEG